ncbi:MFS transporter [Desulfosporosinus lacus]|uniref:Predicted arabinose efflux permease, MFS family n=1 Tax=Desulfosporosinus lacus DSM 15449 TaxID=1121420 RepID=A0A1M5ZU62_9FIRM|nr:MFS transporter [Desulfosporosinus lacus]SHI27825.1 Predicted arabinose efflux permease, MFS family [Desulfosporosinus lacus DSM 15449]
MFKDKTLLGLVVAVVLMMIGVGMVVTLLPQRVVDLDGNGRSVGYIASAFAFSYLLLQVPIGRLSDKIGFKPLLIAGYLLCFLTGLVFYFATSSNMIFFARLLQGAGEAPVWALAPALLSLRFPLAKGKVMGIYNAAFHFGLTVGPFLGVVLAKVLNSNEIFLVYSFSCLVGAIVIYFLVETPAKKEEQTIDLSDYYQNILELVKQQQTLICFMGITLYGAGYGILHTTIPAFLLQEKAFSAVDIGVFFSLFYLAISLSQILTGSLSDRFGRNSFMILGLLIAAVGIIVSPAFSFPLILLVLAISSLGLGVFHLASMAFLNESVPNSLKGTILGTYYLFWGVGMFFGPPIMTRIAASVSFQVSMAAYSFLILLVAVGMMKILGWKSKCQAPNKRTR